MPGFMPGIHVFRHSQGKDVDGRDKPGHDVETHCLSFVMPAHSRPCLSIVMPAHSRPCLSIVMPGFMPGIHVFTTLQKSKTWMAGTSPAMTRKFSARTSCTSAGAE
jgi:hypothetical protein